MKFAFPIASSTLGWLAAVLTAAIIGAYLLKMRRRRFEVPFSNLWHRVLRESESNSLWKKLKRLLSLLLTLLMLWLLIFASFDPRLGTGDESARHIVIIVDASASMKAIDSGEQGRDPRMTEARTKTREVLDSLGGADTAMLIEMDAQPTPLSRFDSDTARLKRLAADITADDSPADLLMALSTAADALRDRKNPMIIIIGDGAYSQTDLESVRWATKPGDEDNLAQVDLTGIDVRFSPIGSASGNVGIVGFNVRRYITNKLNYEVFIELQNFGPEPATRKLVLYNGDTEIDVSEITIAPGERERRIYPDLGGGEDSILKARIEAPQNATIGDVFAVDDVAWALLPAPKAQRVLIVTRDNLYLEGALLVYENLDVFKITPDEYEANLNEGSLGEFSAVVFDDYTPAELPPAPTPLLYFHPSGTSAPFPVQKTLPAAAITQVAEEHPTMRWLSMSDVHFDSLDVYKLQESDVSLARSVRSTVAAATVREGRKIAAFGFSIAGTDLTLRVAFPLLLYNTLDWFSGGAHDLFTTYPTGKRIEIPLGGDQSADYAQLQPPSGEPRPVPISDGTAAFYTDSVGIYSLAAATPSTQFSGLRIAANLANDLESAIQPRNELALGGRVLKGAPESRVRPKRTLWRFLILAALALLLIEWFTFHRRHTV